MPLDDAVGSIVAAIDKHGLSENTFVIFVNDNGGPIYTGVQSNGPLKLGKLFLFEGGIRVPMVIKLPGKFEPDTVYDHPTSTLDLFPTICAAAGIKVPSGINLDGVDLTPFVNGQSTGARHMKPCFGVTVPTSRSDKATGNSSSPTTIPGCLTSPATLANPGTWPIQNPKPSSN